MGRLDKFQCGKLPNGQCVPCLFNSTDVRNYESTISDPNLFALHPLSREKKIYKWTRENVFGSNSRFLGPLLFIQVLHLLHLELGPLRFTFLFEDVGAKR